MAFHNPNSYLETQVLTSPPQKLQLILIEAAIRFTKKAQFLREDGDEAGACEAIERAQKIVAEIIGGLNQEIDLELVGQIASIYIFISRTLSQAHLPENNLQLADAIRVLEEERTTWKLVCEKIATEGADQNQAAILHQQLQKKETSKVDMINVNATAGHATTLDDTESESATGFSIDA